MPFPDIIKDTMATYKLIQDIEAEDKILGPLTFRQFVFALVAAFFGYLCFLSVAKQIWPLLVIVLPLFLLAVFFAFPFGRDQPTEIWALAIIRFWFKPHKRVWDQSGIKELVTVTAPKKVERIYTDGLSQPEVQSRLKALARTLDSRGWAIKNINVDSYVPNPLTINNRDRLLDIYAVPEAVPDTVVEASEDMLDEEHNPIAQQFDSMINQSAVRRRQELLSTMNTISNAQVVAPQLNSSNLFFMNSPATAGTSKASYNDATLSAQIHAAASSRRASYGNLRTLRPLGSQQQQAPVTGQPTSSAMTTPSHPAILALATNNDFNVSTIAREAKKAKGNEDEVVVSLH
jgi:hypothetical protein